MPRPKRIVMKHPREDREIVTNALRLEMPFGKWTCADGREVLFNRHYFPIWEKCPGTPAAPADPAEWVPFEKQEWFFSDGNPPWRDRASLLKCKSILEKFTTSH